MIRFFIHRILAWAAGLSSSDFKTALSLVENAESTFSQASDKRAYVLNALKSSLPKIATWALGLLLELAVATLNKSKP